MKDRVLEFSEAAFERAVRRKVRALFEAARVSPDASNEIPVIGEMHGYEYSPHGPVDPELEDLVVRAVRAKFWFEKEAAPWAQPLLLRDDECRACFNLGPGDHRRDIARGEYGLYLRTMGWHLERVQPFEIRCAQQLAGGSF